MLTPENLPQLNYILQTLQSDPLKTAEIKESALLIKNAIDVLEGSYLNVPFSVPKQKSSSQAIVNTIPFE